MGFDFVGGQSSSVTCGVTVNTVVNTVLQHCAVRDLQMTICTLYSMFQTTLLFVIIQTAL